MVIVKIIYFILLIQYKRVSPLANPRGSGYVIVLTWRPDLAR